MANYKLQIESLSDLCVSDGGVYNSSLDIDICHDIYGFPVIPAKRIKGCLRESAQELSDWGEPIPENLFGSEGSRSNAGWVTISDAVLSDSVKFSSEINASDSAIYHPQNVLDHYSYVRTQTSIDRVTGVAKNKSLRTMRVSNKNLIFTAELKVNNPIKGGFLSEKEEKDVLDVICANLTHMGNSRTRGLGEVRVTVETAQNSSVIVADAEKKDGAEVLTYEILLEEPVICKSVMGAESHSQDYIDGGKILGIVAGRYRSEYGKEIIELLNKGLLEFSNAYISSGSCRFSEVPGYVYAIKNHKESYINKVCDPDNKAAFRDGETRQLNAMKHTYVHIASDGSLMKRDVLLEERYHHRRPNDKSIGRASKNDSDNSSFYQLSSISSGQHFRGFVKGTAEQISTIYDLLVTDKNCRIGYGNSSEYGKCCITQLRTEIPERNEILSDCILVTLQAPAIVYNSKAMYSSDVDDLKEEILAACGIPVDTEAELTRYVRYTNVGGFNVTWNQRKPTVVAFDKGTALVLKFKTPQKVSVPAFAFLGERTTEGFGEFSVSGITSAGTAEYPVLKIASAEKGQEIDFQSCPFAGELSVRLFGEFINSETIRFAGHFKQERYRPTVSNMILMCNETDAYESIREAVESRYGKKSTKKEDKLKMANEILEVVDKNVDDVKRLFADRFRIRGFEPAYDMKYAFLKALLQQIKYNIRANASTSGEEDNGNE